MACVSSPSGHSEDQPIPARSLSLSSLGILMMINALLISTAAYAVSTFLCVAPVRAEDEKAAAFPSLPLPPEIAEFIGLCEGARRFRSEGSSRTGTAGSNARYRRVTRPRSCRSGAHGRRAACSGRVVSIAALPARGRRLNRTETNVCERAQRSPRAHSSRGRAVSSSTRACRCRRADRERVQPAR